MADIYGDGETLRELALFAGAGGGILGGKLLGWRTVCAVECDPYAASVLVRRQNDGHLATFPVWDDVRTFDGRPWRGIVDVISGGFPCQDISIAGKGKGIKGSKSGLWREFARIIDETRPEFVFMENSPIITRRGLGRILKDLFEMGFDAEWGCISAKDCGASHKRERFWLVASNTLRIGSQRRGVSTGQCQASKLSNVLATLEVFPRSIDDLSKPRVVRAGTRMAHRVDRTRAIGNGQVPIVAAIAWRILSQKLLNRKS